MNRYIIHLRTKTNNGACGHKNTYVGFGMTAADIKNVTCPRCREIYEKRVDGTLGSLIAPSEHRGNKI